MDETRKQLFFWLEIGGNRKSSSTTQPETHSILGVFEKDKRTWPLFRPRARPDFSASFAMAVVIGGRYREVVIKGPRWVSCASWLVRGGVLETRFVESGGFVGLDVRIELWGWLLNAARLLWVSVWLERACFGRESRPWHANFVLEPSPHLSIRAYHPASCATSRGRAGEAERQWSLVPSGTSIASGYAGCWCRNEAKVTHQFYEKHSRGQRSSRASPSTESVRRVVPH